MSSKPILRELPSTIPFTGSISRVESMDSGNVVHIQTNTDEHLVLQASQELSELATQSLAQRVVGSI